MKVKELVEKLKRFKPDDEARIGRMHDGDLVLAICRPVKWRNGREIVVGLVRLEKKGVVQGCRVVEVKSSNRLFVTHASSACRQKPA